MEFPIITRINIFNTNKRASSLQKEIKKAKFFYSVELNADKFDVIQDKACRIRDFKNKISAEIHANILNYLDCSRFDVVKIFNTQIENLTGQDIQNAITDVWTNYSVMLDSLKSSLTFKIPKKKSSKLSMILSFLAKYGYVGIADALTIPEHDAKKAIFFKEIKDYCAKFGEDRLLRLALSRRTRLIRYKCKQIKYEQLSFRTITRIKSDIFGFNTNKKSIFNGFINLGGYSGYKKLSIPTRHNLAYHGTKSNYAMSEKGANHQSYQVQIVDAKRRLVRITYLVDDVWEIPDEKGAYIGVDINVKRNLFSTEIGFIDFDRNLLNEYIKFLKKIDNRKVKTLNARRTEKYKTWKLRIKNEIKHRMSDLIKFAKSAARNHLILEDLSLLHSSKIPSDFGITYGRLFRLLGLSSIKTELENMCRNQQIAISFVQPEYSSQTCHPCGHISEENRKKQSDFICVSCGHSDDADINSPKNLQHRVTSDVLRRTLLDKNEFNEFRPKRVSMSFVRSAIRNGYHKSARA